MDSVKNSGPIPSHTPKVHASAPEEKQAVKESKDNYKKGEPMTPEQALLELRGHLGLFPGKYSNELAVIDQALAKERAENPRPPNPPEIADQFPRYKPSPEEQALLDLRNELAMMPFQHSAQIAQIDQTLAEMHKDKGGEKKA